MENGRHSMETEEERRKAELGLHTISHGFEKNVDETITKIVEGSLRSGKKVEFEGTLVIIGDVNAGAEVIAEDNIIILGALRGLAHAGAKGNRKAKIFANRIDAPQIRIADIVKEKEVPVIQEEEEEDTKKRKKNKKQEIEEIDYEYEEIKTKAFISNNEIVLQ